MNAEQLIRLFQGYLAARDGYIPGASGQLWTREKQQKSDVPTVQKHGAQWIGHHVEDCSGAFVRAYKSAGLSIYHGSNRIARVFVRQLLPPDQARPGMAAFKGRGPGEKGYDLPGEYRPGGQYYTGDLVDYYHIGLVDSDPQYVINAQSTQTGVVRSKLSSGWCAVGYLKDITYGGGNPMQNKMMVVIGDGYVNLRSGPDQSDSRIEKLYPGDVVTLLKDYGNGWSFVQHCKRQGYVMTEFLQDSSITPEAQEASETPAAPDAPLDGDALPLLYQAIELSDRQRELLEQLQIKLTGSVG